MWKLILIVIKILNGYIKKSVQDDSLWLFYNIYYINLEELLMSLTIDARGVFWGVLIAFVVGVPLAFKLILAAILLLTPFSFYYFARTLNFSILKKIRCLMTNIKH